MLERNTDDLKQELMSAPDLTQFIKENERYFIEKDMAGYLQEIFQQKNISKSSLAKRANISEVYLHQVFAGQRNLSRNKLLCVCIGLSATLDETQNLLQKAVTPSCTPKASGTPSLCMACSIGWSCTPSMSGF